MRIIITNRVFLGKRKRCKTIIINYSRRKNDAGVFIGLFGEFVGENVAECSSFSNLDADVLW